MIPFIGGACDAITEKFDVEDLHSDFQALYDNVLCIDFQSLYPSIIIAMNICYTTYVYPQNRRFVPKDMCNIIVVDATEDYDPAVSTDGLDEEEKVELRNKHNYCEGGKKGRYEFWFIKKEYFKGMLPDLVDNLCKNRRKVQALQKIEEDPFLSVVLDKQQNGLKISANSFFGFLGVLRNGKRPLREAAVSITACGRNYIGIVNTKLIEKYGALVIYNDTDSSMVVLEQYCNTMTDCQRMIKEISNFITSLFPDDIIMKPEWVGRMLVIKCKKYCYMTSDLKNPEEFTKENGRDKINCKGLLPVRRDNCKQARDLYLDILYMIMHRESYLKVILYLIDNIKYMLEGHVDYKQFLITRSLRDHYKQENYFMKIFSEELAKMQRPAQPGERLCYLVSAPSDQNEVLGKRMRLKEQYEDSLLEGNPINIDYIYYISKILMNPVDQLISLVYRKESRHMVCVADKKSAKSKLVGMNKPVSHMITLLQKGIGVEELKDKVIERMASFDFESNLISFFDL